MPSFFTSETSVLNLEKLVYESRIDGYESDWKLFRVKIVEWQERYMDKVNKKLIKVLSDEKLPPSEKFWKAEKLIIREKKSAGVIVEMSRSMFKINLLKLLNEKAITMDDLADFSPELQEEIKKVKEG